MNGLKHGIFFADVCTACRAYAALKLRSFICNNIAVKVRKNKYLEIGTALFVDKLGCCDVYIPLVRGDFGVILAYVFAKVKEFTVGSFDDVCLCDNRNSVFLVSSCIVICELCNSFAALGGGNNKVNRKVVCYINSL